MTWTIAIKMLVAPIILDHSLALVNLVTREMARIVKVCSRCFKWNPAGVYLRILTITVPEIQSRNEPDVKESFHKIRKTTNNQN